MKTYEHPRGDRGLTLLEIIIAMGILVVAIIGIMSALVSAIRVDEATAEQVRALNACKSKIEEMKTVPFAEAWARFNATPGDDPGGAGTAPGPNFAVPGLRPLTGDADGLPGQIIFPEVGNILSETVVDARMGMPRDLNGDGDALDVNVSTTYKLLPVRVVVDWQGSKGAAHVELTTFLNP